jgi:hypothetical protein
MFGTHATFQWTAKSRGAALAPNIGQIWFYFDLELVELTGIEPVTSCLQSRRSPN